MLWFDERGSVEHREHGKEQVAKCIKWVGGSEKGIAKLSYLLKLNILETFPKYCKHQQSIYIWYITDFPEEVDGIESAELACQPTCLPDIEVEDNRGEGAGIGAGAAGVGGEKTAKNTTKQKQATNLQKHAINRKQASKETKA